MARDHRDLEVWKKSHRLALDIYRVSKTFPREELYGLTTQLRRAAVAISANLAEGAARQSSKEFAQFCYIARGSASEVDNLLLIARDLGFLSEKDYGRLQSDCCEIARMLTSMIKALQSR